MYSVIVVEDEAVLRKGIILTTDWAELGIRVIGEADNGLDGELLARKVRPDIIITDIAMPGLDGLEMIQNLYEELADTEFLIISGHAEFAYAQKALFYGVKGYLLKPIDPKELIRHLKRTIADVERRKEEYSKDIRLEQLELGMQTFPIIPLDAINDYRDEYIKEAIAVIEKHYAEHLSTSDIAMHLGISDRNLTNLFKERSGYTLLEYLSLFRMKRATHYLQKKELSVYEVASLVGYKDYRYFSKVFKSTFSMTPLEYKKGGRE
ncbi:MAG TPA: response regulator [Sphaerochaeta sp.]|nr:response regulator [Sphaerochaeta sp.]